MERHSTISNTLYVFLLLLIPCSLLLSSCKEDEKNAVELKGKPLQITADIQYLGEDGTYRLEGGESVGLWVSSLENSLAQADVTQNTKFYQSAGGLVSEPRTYWGDKQQLYIYGYYPFDYQAEESPEAYNFAVELTQKGMRETVASDLLWTKQTVSVADADKKVQLGFQHLMSKLIVNVRGSRPDAGSLRECSVKINALYNAIVNLKNGGVEASGEADWVSAMSLGEVADSYESSLQLILVPQTIDAEMPFLKVITKGNVENEWNLGQELVLESGKQVVLDVLIEETECIVTIQEISPWVVDGDIMYAEAVETLPSYNLYDFYSRFGVQGIVISLDEGTDGQHGWLVSTDEAELQWSPNDVTNLKGFSRTDIALNLKLALTADATLESFPAIKWCDDKNSKRTTLEDLEENGVEKRWVLLPVTNLKNLFGDTFLSYSGTNKLNSLNAAIENASVPLSDKVLLPTINWYDPYYTIDYWSSSHVGGQNLGRMVRCQTNDYSMYGNSGVFTSTSDVSVTCKVRAFYHF